MQEIEADITGDGLPAAPPKLSVIVPVYNERRLVAESLRRLAAAPIPAVGEREIIVVDDGSTDGSREVVRGLATSLAGLRLIECSENRGKGAAIRRGVAAAEGDLIVFHDADLEYDPRDLQLLAQPFDDPSIEAVYGSRFRSGERRIISASHEVGNRLITAFSNLFTGLGLSDVETCYKMIRAPLLAALPLSCDDFAVEVEITAKLANRGVRIFEVPIRYRGRSRREGKKITWRDGLRALAAVVRYRFEKKRPAPKGRPENTE